MRRGFAAALRPGARVRGLTTEAPLVSSSSSAVLLRDFIQSALYEAESGYYSTKPCLSPKHPFEFNRMIGKFDWLRAQQSVYASGFGWSTPVELFQPTYSRALAKWILEGHDKRGTAAPLRIYEVGGGNGTNAKLVCEYLKEQRPNLLFEYTIIEISPAMASKQRETLKSLLPLKHVRVAERDVLQWSALVPEHAVVLALEVLDNLPHDKLTRRGVPWNTPLTFDDPSAWLETVVEPRGPAGVAERVRPLQDALCAEAGKLFVADPETRAEDEAKRKEREAALSSSERRGLWFARRDRALEQAPFRRWRWESAEFRNSRSVFVPTGSLKLMHVLKKYFPKHRLLMADFNFLPVNEFADVWWKRWRIPPPTPEEGSVLGVLNAPIVAGHDGVDYPSYLNLPKVADILFATDFDALARAHAHVVGDAAAGPLQVRSSRSFLEAYANTKATETRNGYNPMLEDFINTSFIHSA